MNAPAAKLAGTERWLCVSIHDVALSTWAACERVLHAVREVADIPVTLLIVPVHHGEPAALAPAFTDRLSRLAERGHELALHGYYHRDNGVPRSPADWLKRRVYTAGEGEFCALNEAEAAERLLLGIRWFDAQGWPIEGFVPPAWLLGEGSWRALLSQPRLRYVTTFDRLHLLRQQKSLPAPCLTFSTRSPLRRAAALAWAASARRNCHHAVLRLSLHPHDADYPALRRAWQHRLAELLHARVPLTKAAAAQHCAAGEPVADGRALDSQRTLAA